MISSHREVSIGPFENTAPPKISFVIGVRNERSRLPAVIESIRRQRYPEQRIEIIVADGRSDDGTRDYARSQGCRVVDNPVIRCEPGIALGMEAATGDIAVTLAADNILADDSFIERIVRPFEDPAIVGAVPRVVSVPRDPLTVKYINRFTDPFNHFLYGAAASAESFRHAYPLLQDAGDYVVYDLRAGAPPLLALAQGFAVRLPWRRPRGSEEDDIEPVISLIERGGLIAIVSGARVEHHTVAGLVDFLRKFRPRIAARLRDGEFPVWQRCRDHSTARRLRAFAWPLYSVSVIFPALAALIGYARERDPLWFAHPGLSFALGAAFWREYGAFVLEKGRR